MSAEPAELALAGIPFWCTALAECSSLFIGAVLFVRKACARCSFAPVSVFQRFPLILLEFLHEFMSVHWDPPTWIACVFSELTLSISAHSHARVALADVKEECLRRLSK